MKKNIITLLLTFALCIFLIIPAAGAQTREGVIYLEGMEETIEETLFESPDGYSFWYANECLEAYNGTAGDVQGAVVVNPYSDDCMIISVITEEEAQEYLSRYSADIPEGSAASPFQIELYLELEDAQFSFCTLITDDGRYLRAAGQYSLEAAEGTAKYFQQVLDSVAFSEAGD